MVFASEIISITHLASKYLWTIIIKNLKEKKTRASFLIKKNLRLKVLRKQHRLKMIMKLQSFRRSFAWREKNSVKVIWIYLTMLIDLLQYLRANLLFNYREKNKELLLASSPVDIDFELFIVACGLNLMRGMLNTKYKTTIQ
jgi:hypothetical protein